jgi:DNA-binding winged helix-turn-helix (wHTH) protein
MPDEKKHIRIFISSPSDVLPERDIAYKVIAYIHDILQTVSSHLKFSIPGLQAVGWEGVSPKAGIPNEVILSHFPPEESDIFIFILWTRFGSPPYTRSKSGKKYISGTQEEFERAYEIFLQNNSARPVIMVYKKTNEFSITKLDRKGVKQYNNVLKFFEECEGGKKHPALVSSFKTDEFEEIIRKHLLGAIIDLVFEKKREGGHNKDNVFVSKKPDQMDNGGDNVEAALLDWLMQKNLSNNPFKQNAAEDEDEKDVAKYYVPSTELLLLSSEIIQSRKNWVFFGVEGSGKTALRKFISSNCAPSRSKSRTLAVTFETKDFLEILVQTTDFAETILRISKKIFRSAMEASGNIEKYADEIDKIGYGDKKNPILVFQDLAQELPEYDRILFLLDIAPENSLSPSRLVEIFSSLATIQLDKIGFRLFLNKSFKNKFTMQETYLGKCDLRDIKWEDKDLRELIKKRLEYYSIDKGTPNNALAPLCEPKGKMRSIDDEIIKLAEGNPRAIIWLANELILTHCQSDPIVPMIELQSWEKVHLKWLRGAKNHVLGPSGSMGFFFTSGEEVYFKNNDQPLKLSKRTKLLLKSLIDAEERICSKDEIVRFAWRGDNSDGVTGAAVHEAIRRLKNELEKKNSIDPGWIKTIYGQGYQLQEPKGDITIGRDATNSVIIQGSHNKVNLRVGKRTGKEES